MKTLLKQISLFTEDELTSSQGDFHASHTQWQASDLEKKMSDTSGRKCLERFEKFGRVGLWAKTFSGLLIGQEGWSSTRCRLIWKLKGTKYNRMYFQLVPSTHRTEETEFGLLPTPNTCDANNANNKDNHDVKRGYLRGFASMGMLPTPTLQDYTNSTFPPSQMKRGHVVGHLMREGISPGSQLNPRFVAEMMGFPPNWTELPFLNGETNQSKPEETP
jgi:hypothetical protein